MKRALFQVGVFACHGVAGILSTLKLVMPLRIRVDAEVQASISPNMARSA